MLDTSVVRGPVWHEKQSIKCVNNVTNLSSNNSGKHCLQSTQSPIATGYLVLGLRYLGVVYVTPVSKVLVDFWVYRICGELAKCPAGYCIDQIQFLVVLKIKIIQKPGQIAAVTVVAVVCPANGNLNCIVFVVTLVHEVHKGFAFIERVEDDFAVSIFAIFDHIVGPTYPCAPSHFLGEKYPVVFGAQTDCVPTSVL